MRRDHAIAVLASHADELKTRGATALYLFGSTARDEAGEESDLDLFLDYDPDSKFSLLTLVQLQRILQERLAAPVDLTTRDSLHPLLRDGIERSAIRVF